METRTTPDAPDPSGSSVPAVTRTAELPDDATGDLGYSPGAGPLTASLLGKLFAVPFLIIGTIVGGAVLVVLLFGGPASPQRRGVDSLLQSLEASSGGKSMGLLLPREKELWQTAVELSMRLEKKNLEAQLTEAELKSVAARLSALVRADLANLDSLLTSGSERLDQRAVRSRRLEFVIHALGRTERPEAVGPLLDVLRDGREPYVTVAMQELGELRALPETRQAIEPITEILTTTTGSETRLMACTVLSVLATSDDQGAIDALAATRLSSEGEVAWSAALALARLGSRAGKSTLLDLLDRSFLESDERYHVSDAAGNVRRYRLPPQRVDEFLLAAIGAASKLDDAELRAMIERLESDPSPAVRVRATDALRSGAG